MLRLSMRQLMFSALLLLVGAVAAGYVLLRQNVNITYGSPPPAAADESVLQYLTVADGYEISIFAALNAPVRQLAVADDGWIFAGTTADKVFALRDGDGDGVAERRLVVAEGLPRPHGVAFHDGALYIGTVPRILRVDNVLAALQDGDAAAAEISTFAEGFIDSSHHGTRHVKVGPDGKLYVSLGVPCNICIPPSAEFSGVIRRYALSGGDAGEVYAQGIRNAVGFDFHPRSGALWFTDNGRDWLGDDAPHDELNRVSVAGEHFGYPYCHQGDMPDPEFGGDGDCADFTPPAQLTGPHVANLGMVFDAAGERAYIALHGSWNSSVKVGYAVYQAVIADGAVVEYAPFVTGWLRPDESVYGRPVDLVRLPDGALLLSDDFAGVVYLIRKSAGV